MKTFLTGNPQTDSVMLALETISILRKHHRQLAEIRKKRNMKVEHVILAVDFDGTICSASYPEIGMEREGAKEYINKLYDEGYAIVINTCRSDDGKDKAAQMAKDFLKLRGIKYHAFNENMPHLIDFYGCDTRKISADVYIDDKCLFEIPTWEDKYTIIKRRYPDPFNKEAEPLSQYAKDII